MILSFIENLTKKNPQTDPNDCILENQSKIKESKCQVSDTTSKKSYNGSQIRSQTDIKSQNTRAHQSIRESNQNFNFSQLAAFQLKSTIKNAIKSDYQQLIDLYKKTNKKFTDRQFPPTGKSIGGRWVNHNNWKRISDIIPNHTFVKDKIQPSDILQGEIGDCYFLSALAALAEKDYRIKNIFPNLEIQKNGIYMAKILHKGLLRQVVVDDYIPVNQKDEPIFARPAGGNQIWVVILEKCWAKLYGSYEAIIGGLPHEALHAFSGAPTLYNSIPNNKEARNQLFEQFYEAQKNGAVLCCGTKFDAELQNKGLVLGHAYTLLDIYKQPHRMVKIRNPWGQREWSGRASQKDKQFWDSISQQDKEKLGFLSKNDGIFFMLWDDFVEVFNMVDLCLIDDKAEYLCVKNKFQFGKGIIYSLEVKEPGNVVVAVSQDNLRGASRVQIKRGFSKTTIIVAKVNQQGGQTQYSFKKASQYQVLPDHYLILENLTQGNYLIYVECNWLNKQSKQATVSIYSRADLWFEIQENLQNQKFLYEIFMNHARRNHKKRTIISHEPLQWYCSDFLLEKCGYGYVVYHLDPQSQQKLGVELDEKQYNKKNLSLLRPYAGNGKIRTIVQPGKELIILFKIDPYRCPLSFSLPLPKICKIVN